MVRGCAGYVKSDNSFSWKLGGLFVLYCLYETQLFNPRFLIYLSLGKILLLSYSSHQKFLQQVFTSTLQRGSGHLILPVCNMFYAWICWSCAHIVLRKTTCGLNVKTEDLEKLHSLVKELKRIEHVEGLKVVQTMLTDKVFLFGCVAVDQKSISDACDKLAREAGARLKHARSR